MYKMLLCRSFTLLNDLISQVDEAGPKGRKFDKIYEMVNWMTFLGHESIRFWLVKVNFCLHHSAAAGLKCSVGVISSSSSHGGGQFIIKLYSLWQQNSPRI